MSWSASLTLQYQRDGARTVLRHQHQGPLRIFKSLYPEGDGVCHNVIVHPPGGLVGGDDIHIDVHVQPHAHALISTPGATRYYASDHDAASQRTTVRVGEGARLEWLPLETIAYSGCRGRNQWHAALAPSAQVIAWDVLALGLPHASQAFASGWFEQQVCIDGLWREQGRIAADDHRLLHSPLGLASHTCMGTLWWACGTPPSNALRESVLGACRAALDGGDGVSAVTCPNEHVLAVRSLALTAEPVMHALQAAWAAVRQSAWAMDAPQPRIWQV